MGKTADILHALAKHYSEDYQKKMWKSNKGWKPIRVVFMDVPRRQGNKINYNALESLKNGLFFSTKYESGMVRCAVPHIVVFANSPPDEGALSADRWDIHEIKDVDLAPIDESEYGGSDTDED